MKSYIWCIAYIDPDKISKIPKDLKKNRQYRGIEYSIPTVRVLKKQLKGKDFFKEVPLLFNYGFFKIPLAFALNIDLLNKIQQDISCISNWVKDRAKKGGPKDPEDENAWRYELCERDVPIATTSEAVVDELCKIADDRSIFSSTDIEKVRPGDIVNLMGYPYDGMRAEVISIDIPNKKVKVSLANLMEETEDLEETFDMEVTVHFDSVFYTIYQGSHDEDYRKEDNYLEDYHINRRKTRNNEV